MIQCMLQGAGQELPCRDAGLSRQFLHGSMRAMFFIQFRQVSSGMSWKCEDNYGGHRSGSHVARATCCRGNEVARRHPKTSRQQRSRTLLASSRPLGTVTRKDGPNPCSTGMAAVHPGVCALPPVTGRTGTSRNAHVGAIQDMTATLQEDLVQFDPPSYVYNLIVKLKIYPG